MSTRIKCGCNITQSMDSLSPSFSWVSYCLSVVHSLFCDSVSLTYSVLTGVNFNTFSFLFWRTLSLLHTSWLQEQQLTVIISLHIQTIIISPNSITEKKKTGLSWRHEKAQATPQELNEVQSIKRDSYIPASITAETQVQMQQLPWGVWQFVYRPLMNRLTPSLDYITIRTPGTDPKEEVHSKSSEHHTEEKAHTYLGRQSTLLLRGATERPSKRDKPR